MLLPKGSTVSKIRPGHHALVYLGLCVFMAAHPRYYLDHRGLRRPVQNEELERFLKLLDSVDPTGEKIQLLYDGYRGILIIGGVIIVFFSLAAVLAYLLSLVKAEYEKKKRRNRATCAIATENTTGTMQLALSITHSDMLNMLRTRMDVNAPAQASHWVTDMQWTLAVAQQNGLPEHHFDLPGLYGRMPTIADARLVTEWMQANGQHYTNFAVICKQNQCANCACQPVLLDNK